MCVYNFVMMWTISCCSFCLPYVAAHLSILSFTFWGKAFDLIDDDDSGFITKSVSVPFSIFLHSIDRQ